MFDVVSIRYGLLFLLLIVFFKQKTAYELRISDWSSDGCSSDLLCLLRQEVVEVPLHRTQRASVQDGRARQRQCRRKREPARVRQPFRRVGERPYAGGFGEHAHRPSTNAGNQFPRGVIETIENGVGGAVAHRFWPFCRASMVAITASGTSISTCRPSSCNTANSLPHWTVSLPLSTLPRKFSLTPMPSAVASCRKPWCLRMALISGPSSAAVSSLIFTDKSLRPCGLWAHR